MKVSDLCGLGNLLDGVSSLRGLDHTIGALFSDLRAELGCEDQPCGCSGCDGWGDRCTCEGRNDDDYDDGDDDGDDEDR